MAGRLAVRSSAAYHLTATTADEWLRRASVTDSETGHTTAPLIMQPEEGALIDSFRESFSAIDILCEHRMILPALVLLYSAMDAAAWLDVKEDRDVRRTDFVLWVESYLLPGSGLDCTGLELYGARCGLLHTFTAFSKLSREGKIRTVSYATGTASVKDLNETTALLHRNDVVGVHIDALRRALEVAVQRFLDDASTNRERWANVVMRAKNLFSHLPTAAMADALQKLRVQDAEAQ